MDKKQIREFIMKKRSALSTGERASHSQAILSFLTETETFKSAQQVASFVDFRNEVYMAPINEAILSAGKSLYLPYVNMKAKIMTFHEVKTLDDLVLSSYGILEPDPNATPPADIQMFDLILSPGVAFDFKGYRLGYGGGFYDRFFSALSGRPPKIGIAFSCQQLDNLPTEAHDLPLDALITENGITYFK